MAYAHSITRVTISGTSFGGAEEWSTGFFLGDEGDDVSNPTEGLADDIATAWQTFFTAAGSLISNNWKTDTVKLAQLNTDGTTQLDNVVYHTYTTPITGAASVGHLPAQCSIVATLQSSLTRGMASKGRMYLPGPAILVQTTGKISSTNTGTISTNLKTFLDAVNTASGIAGQLILASKGRTVPTVVAGINKEVTTVRVGDVVDTQRRRRNQLTESYTSATLA